MEHEKHEEMKGYMDLGRKDSIGVPEMSTKSKPMVRYPSLYIEKDASPNKKVGDTMTASIKLRLKGMEEREQNGKKTVRCDYEVMAIQFGGGGSHYKKD